MDKILKENKELNLFIVLDHFLYLRGPFHTWEDLDNYIINNMDDEGFLHFHTDPYGEVMYSPEQLEIIDNPYYKENVSWE